jgi:hypothetical protein
MSTKCRKTISVINILFIIGGCITTGVASTNIPQTVSNFNNTYIGTADEYNTDLRNAQIGSYAFKVTMISLSITIANFISLFIACFYRVDDIEPIPRRVSIHPTPTVIEIPNNDTINENKQNNIKKWLGDTVI